MYQQMEAARLLYMDDEVSEHSASEPRPHGHQHRTVLVVDDSEDAQELLRFSLESAGYSVIVAQDGRSALRLIAEMTLPSLIVVDLLMPRMGGMELIEALRSFRR